MKIASYRDRDGEAVYGVVDPSGGLITADAEFRRHHPSLRTLLAESSLEELADHVHGRSPDCRPEDVNFLPPVHDAGKVICVGINYPKRHPVEGVIPPPENIILFGKFDGVLVGHDEPLVYPPEPACRTFDYEGELAFVIGKSGRFIPKEHAFDHIAGFTIMNDGSVREWQKHSLQAGKNFTHSSSCGPWFVTADEIEDVSAMRLSTRLNGDEVQRTTVAEMIFDIPTIVNYISGFIELMTGDVIATGSPEGSGGSRDPQRFLVPGDELEIEWSGIGVLRNRVEKG